MTQANAGPPTVLLVDDEPENLETMVRALRSHATLLTAGNVDDAERILKETTIDCLVTDIRMPGRNGVELLFEANRIQPGIGKVVVSAYADSDCILEAINRGHASSFVLKPFTPNELWLGVVRAIRSHAPRVLVIDDERFWREKITDLLSDIGVECGVAVDGDDAVAQARAKPWDALLLDLNLVDESGFEVLPRLRDAQPTVPVIVFSATESPQLAAELKRRGARAFLPKSLKTEHLVFEIMSILEGKVGADETTRIASHDVGERDLVGESKAMNQVRDVMRGVAPTQATVLIQGETGTGKEVAAKTIHQLGPRAHEPFLAVNCAALGEVLFESEIFGHEKGAFTGAISSKPGLCEVADQGTLFLDEVGELPLSCQSKLLRFLESGEYLRLGGTKVLHSHARIVAATNRELNRMVDKGTFREDLFHRLNVFQIAMPPLRERSDDIPLLAEFLLRKLSKKHDRHVYRIGAVALSTLMDYGWPGNVRELEHCLERALVRCDGDSIEQISVHAGSTSSAGDDARPLKLVVADAIERAERSYLSMLMRKTEGSVSAAARIAEVERRNFYRKLRQYELEPEDFRK